MSKNKLKEMIDQAVLDAFLKEDGDYSYDGMSFYDDTPTMDHGGGSSGGRKSIGQIFFDPVKDIAKTATYASKYMATKVKNAAGSILSGLVAGLIPYTDKDGKLGVSRAFNFFNQKEVKELGALDSQYGKYLQNNIEALKNSDVIGLAFLLNPKIILASKLLTTAPGVSLGLLDIITGGEASNLVKSAARHVTYDTHKYTNENQEATGEVTGNANDLSKSLANLAKNDEFQKKLINSPVAKKMQADAAKLILQRVTPILKSTTIDQLTTVTGKDIRATLDQMASQGKIAPQERQAFEQEFIRQFKEMVKQQYIKALESMSQKLPEAANAIQNIINQILAIK